MATNTFVEFRLDDAQPLADYTSIAFDLLSARDFATTILEENRKPIPNFSLSDPFMVATIIRYARAFASGVRLKLCEEGGFILTDQQRLKHELFLNLRNKYIAHSINAFEESQPIARYWVESVEEEGIDAIACNHRRVVGLSDDDLQDIIDLASTWLGYVTQKITDEQTRLLAVVRKIPLTDLFQNAPAFTPAPDTSQPQKARVTTKRRRL